MSDRHDRFLVRPPEVTRERLDIPATLYNPCRLLLVRCRYGHASVPLPRMRLQAVIDEREVIFADDHAFPVPQGPGGRQIRLAWQFCRGPGRADLGEPAPVDLVCYRLDARQLHVRLLAEFGNALELMHKRYRKAGGGPPARAVLPFPGAH